MSLAIRSSVCAAQSSVCFADAESKPSASVRISSAIRRHQQTLDIVPCADFSSEPPNWALNASALLSSFIFVEIYVNDIPTCDGIASKSVRLTAVIV